MASAPSAPEIDVLLRAEEGEPHDTLQEAIDQQAEDLRRQQEALHLQQQELEQQQEDLQRQRREHSLAS
eukprot:COSAG04_NODE_1715_length_5819_cov_5.914336_5_plen_69_part_00